MSKHSSVKFRADSGWIGKFKLNKDVIKFDDSAIGSDHDGDETSSSRASSIELKNEYDRSIRNIEKHYAAKLKRLKESREKRINECRLKYKNESRTIGDDEPGGEEYEEEEEEEGRNKKLKYYTPSSNQFSVKGGANACTSISVLSCFMFLTSDSPLPESNWEECVKKGGSFWIHWKQTHPSKNNLQLTCEVLNLNISDCINKEIKIEFEMGGSLNDKYVDIAKEDQTQENCRIIHSIEEVIEHLKSGVEDRRAGVFTIRGETISILYDRLDEDKIWIFDSHGGIKTGLSALIEFDTTKSVIKYIKRNYRGKSTRVSVGSESNTFSFQCFVPVKINGR